MTIRACQQISKNVEIGERGSVLGTVHQILGMAPLSVPGNSPSDFCTSFSTFVPKVRGVTRDVVFGIFHHIAATSEI